MINVQTLLAAGLIASAYLVGSIPASYLIGRFAKGIDISERGSRNLGVSNLTAQAGAWWAVPAVLFDVLAKGTLPVLIASDKVLGLGLSMEVVAGIVGIAGHNWSIFSGFRGGRGMATVLGSIGAMNLPLLIVYGSIPALGVLFTPWKDSAVWWMIGVILLPVWAALLNLPLEIIIFSCVFAALTASKRMTSNSLRGTNGQIDVKLLLTRLVFDRDTVDREAWLNQQRES